MQPFYVQGLLYGAAHEVLVNVAAVAVLVVAARAVSAADAPETEETERCGSFEEVEYAGVIALVAASGGIIVALADKAVDADATASPPLGVEVDAVVDRAAAAAEPEP